jgi:hypothetical protein
LAPAVLLTGQGSTFEAGRFLPGSMPTAIVAVSLAGALVVIPAAFRQMVHVSSTEFSCVYALFGISLARRRLPLAEVTRVWCTDGPRSQGVPSRPQDGSVRLLFLEKNVATHLASAIQDAIVIRSAGRAPSASGSLGPTTREPGSDESSHT